MTCNILKSNQRQSEYTVAILTLNWDNTSYGSITREIKTAINILQQAGTKVNINRVLWHSSIAENEEVIRWPLYSKTCLKRPLKNRRNKGLKDKW